MSDRHDLSANYGQLNQLTDNSKEFVDLASFPDHTVIVIDGIRFDLKKVIAEVSQADVRRQLQAYTFPTDTVIDASQSPLSGKHMVSLYDVVHDGQLRLTVNGTIFNLSLTALERYIWANQTRFAAAPTPVDLNTLPENARVRLENTVVSAHKLRQLVQKKLVPTPAENRKFQLWQVDSAKDVGMYYDTVTLEHLCANDVYAIGAHEYKADEIERLLFLNARKLSPASFYQRSTDSVKSSWEGFRGKANTYHQKYPWLAKAVIWSIVIFMFLDITRQLSDPSHTATLNLLHFLQDPANGFTAYNEILKGVDTRTQLSTINMAFMAVGGWLGYRDFRGSSKYSGLLGLVVGIFVSRVVQFLVVITVAAMLH